MDVTPQELRDVEIRESFRGYHRDEVDELLERAAATIEHLEHQIRVLQERLAAGPGGAPAPAAPGPAPAPTRVPVPDGDVIQRTLILAQKAADEAVAEAQARAQQLTSEAEAKAQALVSEAESTARRIAESERRRIEAEIGQLSATRDALREDVDALQRFASEFRDRLRSALEAEIARLGSVSGLTDELPPRPALRTEGMAFATPAAPAPAPAAPSPSVSEHATAEAVAPRSGPSAGESPGATRPAEPAWSGESAGGWRDDAAAAPAPAAPEEAWSEGPDQGEWEAGSLDDDAFFASLREAVRDEQPLGPREEEYYDDEDTDTGRRLFRRRR